MATYDFNDAGPQTRSSRDWIDQDDLSELLADTAYSWVPALFKQGRRDDEGHIRCASIRGNPPKKQGSCIVYTHGERAGSWHDYDPAVSPNGGGPLSTIKELLGLSGNDLFDYCRQLVGEQPRQRRAKPPPRDDSGEISVNLRSARALPGTLGAKYFAARKIPMPGGRSIGFYDNCTDWRTRRGCPAIICKFTYPDGGTIDKGDAVPRDAIHRIYLKDDGSWHAGKKMLGSVDNGRVILLGEDDGSHTVGIGEGIESTAAGMAICRMSWGWAAASAGGMTKVAEWLADPDNAIWVSEHVKRIALFVDMGKAGTRGANDIEAWARAAEIAVDFVRPLGTDDLADDLFHDRVGHALPFQLTGTSQIAYPTQEQVQVAIAALPFGDHKALDELLLLLAHHALGEQSNGRLANAFIDAIYTTLKTHKGFGNINTLRALYQNAYNLARRSNQQALQLLADEDKLTDWHSLAIRSLDQTIKPILHNVVLAIKHDYEWRDGGEKLVVALNDFRGFPVVRGVLPWERTRMAQLNDERQPFRDWTDADDLAATDWVQGPGRDIAAPTATVTGAIELLASQNKFHPVREFFDSLPPWDRQSRLELLLIYYAGCEDTPINRIFGRKWCIGAVARILDPGCKMDTALIIEGLQGIGKSTFFRILAGNDFFTDQISDFGSKDSALEMQGKWIIELSELDAMNRSETARIKSFLGRQDDRFRPPYGRRMVTRPRQMVFCGTTNENEYLRDATGGRRFWPAKASVLRLDDLQAHREQIWAEAIWRYHHKEAWWLDKSDEVRSATEQQSLRYQGDILEGQIGAWIDGSLTRHEVTISEVLLHGLQITDKLKWDKSLQLRIAAALRHLGYEKIGMRQRETLYGLKDDSEQRKEFQAAAITSPHPEPPQQAAIFYPDDPSGYEPD